MSGEEAWKEVFDQFDTDKSGQVDARELVNLFKGAPFDCDDDTAKANAHYILQEVDKNDDGKVSWDEFLTCMKKKEGQ